MAIVLHIESKWMSPYVFACFVTLREKGIPFEVAELDSAKGETKATDYLAQTITGRVPALVHDGFGVAESSAIVEYLEDAFPEPHVLPANPRDRARCRQIMSWLRSDETAPLREERPTSTMFYTRADKPLSEAAKASATKLVEVASRLVRADRPNLFDAWSIADAELAFILHRLIMNDDPVPANVKAWAAAQWKRPSVRAFVEHERPKS
jgi:glutathione S-transferase